jgi:hypothetical protein
MGEPSRHFIAVQLIIPAAKQARTRGETMPLVRCRVNEQRTRVLSIRMGKSDAKMAQMGRWGIRRVNRLVRRPAAQGRCRAHLQHPLATLREREISDVFKNVVLTGGGRALRTHFTPAAALTSGLPPTFQTLDELTLRATGVLLSGLVGCDYAV